MFGYIAYTAENGKILTFQGDNPYELRDTKTTCVIATVNPLNSTAYIDRMFVNHNDRKTGLASRMLQEVIETCYEQGINTIQTFIQTDNPNDQEGAVKWILSKGFVPSSEEGMFELILSD